MGICFVFGPSLCLVLLKTLSRDVACAVFTIISHNLHLEARYGSSH